MDGVHMKRITLITFIFLLVFSLAACKPQNGHLKDNQKKKTDLTISAAASLNDALMDVKADFEKKNKSIHLLINLGGSGSLQQQIIQGAPVDLFISAANEQFDDLIQKGFVNKKDSSVLLGNKLVLITNKSITMRISNFKSLEKSNIKQIAIGTPESVPAGMYAKQTLESIGIWDKIQAKIIPTKDVRQVLTYVETGNVDAGIVYMTDAKISDKVKVDAVANEKLHDPIVYPAGIIKTSTHKKEAKQFFQYLNSKSAKTIFKKFGFNVLD
jgi:molybdate transport system substrate-binding protein